MSVTAVSPQFNEFMDGISRSATQSFVASQIANSRPISTTLSGGTRK